jgi:hypothetical protein
VVQSRSAITILLIAVSIAAVCAAGNRQTQRGFHRVLQVVAVERLPTIDGLIDRQWQSAPEIVIPIAGGANTSYTEVALRAVYTKDRIAFLAQWIDPTESLAYRTWQKQSDGTWTIPTLGESGDYIGYYEDKFAMAWSINGSVPGFERSACATACHAGEIKRFGLKYTNHPGEKVDVWHWKAARTNPVGQMDDQYIDHTRHDAQTSPDAGRKSDPNVGGGYRDNKTADGKLPAFMPASRSAPLFWLFDSEKQPFQDIFKAGDRVGGIVIAPFAGDRGNISAKGVYTREMWTLEFARLLDTGSAYDAQFTDLKKQLPFGVAVFNNAQTRHSFSVGTCWLQFRRKAHE